MKKKKLIKSNLDLSIYPSNESPDPQYDKLDYGISLGVGIGIIEDIVITGRIYAGIIKRDFFIRSSVFNVGIEYRI